MKYAELQAENADLRRELADANAALLELTTDAFTQGAHEISRGRYNTGGISTYRDLGEWLVKHAGWIREPGGAGRMQTYRHRNAPEPCPACNGAGRQHRHTMEPERINGDELVPAGRIISEPCPACSGAGTPPA